MVSTISFYATCFSAMWPSHLFTQRRPVSLHPLNLGVHTLPSKIMQQWLCVSSRSSPYGYWVWKLLLQPLRTHPPRCETAKPQRPRIEVPVCTVAECPAKLDQAPALGANSSWLCGSPELQLSASIHNTASTQLCPVSSQNAEQKRMTAVSNCYNLDWLLHRYRNWSWVC